MGILGTGCGIPREIASLLACQRAVRRKTAADEQTRKSLVSLFQRTHPEELLNINAQYNCCNAGQTLGLTGTTASEGGCVPVWQGETPGHGAAPPAGTTLTFKMHPCGCNGESVGSGEGPPWTHHVVVWDAHASCARCATEGDEPQAVLF